MSRKQLIKLLTQYTGKTLRRPSRNIAYIRQALIYVLTSSFYEDSLVEEDHEMATSRGFYKSYKLTRDELVDGLCRRGIIVSKTMNRLSCVRVELLLRKEEPLEDDMYGMLRDLCVRTKVYSDLCRTYDSTYGIENLSSGDLSDFKKKVLTSSDHYVLVPILTKMVKMGSLSQKDAAHASFEAQFLIGILLE